MNNKEFQKYLNRLTEEIKDDKYWLDLMNRFVVAWTLFSRIPLPKKWWPAEMPSGNRTLSLAPVAGGMLGLLTGSVISFANILGIGSSGAIWLGAFFYTASGWALHLDGWGDLWDGIGSGKKGNELRSVMKDSRTGAYGVTGLILAFGLWTSIMGLVPKTELLVASSVAAASGRFAACAAAYKGLYPWDKGMGRGWVDTFTGYDLFTSALSLLIFMPFAPIRWIFSAFIAAGIGFASARWMNSRLGGVNGDVLGASIVAAEIAALMVFAI
ncbi:MAG: adenosylcobinamide-GDP ribazoletransferase [Synergistaceae bacterium]|jgi:adenosylcobinamide-GDP ribazoletransferase|nr:adenosylcobinamide-GDP ribazoletransferase [Synergistaceae bacterium]